ncbi:MAG: T9SS type A sorting domain-containing protein [Flavobacteriia bacterium]|nr:T9SS type A sorting domain-containing protein [Flavobacteriia bacterium]
MKNFIFLLMLVAGCYLGAQQNQGELSFTRGVNHGIQGTFYGGVAIGDFDEDGLLDIVTIGAIKQVMTPIPFTLVIESNLHINNGDRTWSASTPFQHLAAYAGGRPIVTDFNNDGHLDVFISGFFESYNENPENFKSFLYLGNGDGTFIESEVIFPWASFYTDAFGLDFDSDGNTDLVFIWVDPNDRGKTKIKLARNNGDGTFTEVISNLPNLSGEHYFGTAFADIDGNGYPDIFYGGFGPTRLFLNYGSGNFEEVINPVLTGGGQLIPFPQVGFVTYAVGDINGDGLPDFVLSHDGDQTLFYANNGDNSFSLLQQFNWTSDTIFLHDFDGDGYDEFYAEAANNDGDGRLFLNDGGTFSLNNALLLEQVSGGSAIAADFDGDGDDDLFYMGKHPETDFAEAEIYFSNLIMGTSDQGENKLSVRVYPNPTSGVLYLESDMRLESFELYALTGAQVSKGALHENRISLENLPAGVYILKVHDGKKVFTQKVIKK